MNIFGWRTLLLHQSRATSKPLFSITIIVPVVYMARDFLCRQYPLRGPLEVVDFWKSRLFWALKWQRADRMSFGSKNSDWYGPVHNAFDAGKSITWENGKGLGPGSQFLRAPNGNRLTARCHFTGPKIFLISRAQPPPTCPRNGVAHIKSITRPYKS